MDTVICRVFFSIPIQFLLPLVRAWHCSAIKHHPTNTYNSLVYGVYTRAQGPRVPEQQSWSVTLPLPYLIDFFYPLARI